MTAIMFLVFGVVLVSIGVGVARTAAISKMDYLPHLWHLNNFARDWNTERAFEGGVGIAIAFAGLVLIFFGVHELYFMLERMFAQVCK